MRLSTTAQAYSLNFTAVPPASLGYLTAWPSGESQPLVSSLNSPTGTIVANAVIVSAGASGAVNVSSSDQTNLVIDINGYFAPPALNLRTFSLTRWTSGLTRLCSIPEKRRMGMGVRCRYSDPCGNACVCKRPSATPNSRAAATCFLGRLGGGLWTFKRHGGLPARARVLAKA